MNSYSGALEECAEKLNKAFREFGERASELWERMKEILENAEPESIEIPVYNWYIPSKIILNNQVLIRKPRMAVARSSC